jgi:CRISPR/Cas system-associated exonuclease Cas4 (RecB family)
MIKSELVSVIKPLHDQHLNKLAKKSSATRGYKHFHPSAFGECLRKIALQYYSEFDERYKPSEKQDPTLQRIFSAGHAFHFRMQHDFAKMGVLRGFWRCRACGIVRGKENKIGIFLPDTCECREGTKDKRKGIKLFTYEEPFVESKKYNFKGHCDGVIEIDKDDPDHRYVIDFKTCNSDVFKMLSEPDHKYVVQVTIYMWLLGVSKGIIYYEDKNRHGVKEFLIELDDQLVSDIKNNSMALLQLIKKNKIPQIASQFTKDRKPCRYCDYKKICWALSKKR